MNTLERPIRKKREWIGEVPELQNFQGSGLEFLQAFLEYKASNLRHHYMQAVESLPEELQEEYREKFHKTFAILNPDELAATQISSIDKHEVQEYAGKFADDSQFLAVYPYWKFAFGDEGYGSTKLKIAKGLLQRWINLRSAAPQLENGELKRHYMYWLVVNYSFVEVLKLHIHEFFTRYMLVSGWEDPTPEKLDVFLQYMNAGDLEVVSPFRVARYRKWRGELLWGGMDSIRKGLAVVHSIQARRMKSEKIIENSINKRGFEYKTRLHPFTQLIKLLTFRNIEKVLREQETDSAITREIVDVILTEDMKKAQELYTHLLIKHPYLFPQFVLQAEAELIQKARQKEKRKKQKEARELAKQKKLKSCCDRSKRHFADRVISNLYRKIRFSQ